MSSWSGRGAAAVLTRRGKVAALRLARLGDWVARPALYPGPRLAPAAEHFPFLLHRASIPLARSDSATHPAFEAGKRVNVSLAAPSFDGLLVEPSRPFSFWRALGRVSERDGYRHGMELNGGCVVPAVGGGLCLISNALFDMAARLGWTILERHGHSAEGASPTPSLGPVLDATVFYPYVDLRFAPRAGRVRLGVRVHGDALEVSARADQPQRVRTVLRRAGERMERRDGELIRHDRVVRQVLEAESGAVLEESVVAVNRRRVPKPSHAGRSCYTCGETECRMRPEFLRGQAR